MASLIAGAKIEAKPSEVGETSPDVTFETVEVLWWIWWLLSPVRCWCLFNQHGKDSFLPFNLFGFDTWNFCLLKFQTVLAFPGAFCSQASFEWKHRDGATQPLAVGTLHYADIREWEEPRGIACCLMNCPIRSENPKGSRLLCPWLLSSMQDNVPALQVKVRTVGVLLLHSSREFHSAWERWPFVQRVWLQKSNDISSESREPQGAF